MAHRSASESKEMDRAWRALVSNPIKLDAIVDAMSRCMGKVLSLKNTEVRDGKATLGMTLYSEKEHFPTRAQMDELEVINDAFAFVMSANDLSNALRVEAAPGTNVSLLPHVDKETFCNTWMFTRPSGDGSSRLKVGGIRQSLYNDVQKAVKRWLMSCDQAMRFAFHDLESDQECVDNKINELVSDIADDIARRVTIKDHSGARPSMGGGGGGGASRPGTRESAPEELTTRALEARAAQEVTRMSIHAEERIRSDLIALRTLETLAIHGSHERGKTVLREKAGHVLYLLSRPHSVLGLNGHNAQRMNLALLSRACVEETDIDVRAGVLSQWHKCHGACAASAAQQAIQKIQLSTQDSWKKPFVQVLRTPDEVVEPMEGVEKPVAQKRAAQACVDMPPMPFVHSTHRWQFVTHADTHGDVFDCTARRAIRLVSLVLQLLGHGAIERGVVCSNIVSPIVTQCCVESYMVLQLLNIKRESYSLGTSLLKFAEDVRDAESHLARDVSEALIHVSGFSVAELAVFSPQSPVLRVIMDQFTTRTRENLTFAMPPQYVAFAYDALAIVLPLIAQRRAMNGTGMLQTLDPVREVLRMVPAVKAWSPLSGALRLYAEDIKGLPALVKNVLNALVRQKILVEYKRPYLGKQRHSPKLAFVFDTPQLVALLAGGSLRDVCRNKPVPMLIE
jgi:hypothetical protein